MAHEKVRRILAAIPFTACVFLGPAPVLALPPEARVMPFEEYFSDSASHPDEIRMILTDPREHSESNTAAAAAGVTLVGKGISYLGRSGESSVSSNPARIALRAVRTFGYGWSSAYFQDASHEVNHGGEALAMGAEDVSVHIKGPFEVGRRSNYSFRLLPGATVYGPAENSVESQERIIVPKQDKETIDRLLRIIQAGPNQNMLNALDSFNRSQRGQEQVYRTIDRLIAQLSQTYYINTDFDDSMGHDHRQTVFFLNEKGMDVSLKRLRSNNWMLNLANPTNWTDLYSVLVSFIGRGEEEISPLRFRVSETVSIGLPYLSHFFTPKGEYATLTEYVLYRDTPIEISLSTDLSFTQKNSELDILRLGTKLYDLETRVYGIKLSPYGAINLSRSRLEGIGFQFGTEFEVPMDTLFTLGKNTYSIIGKFELNNGDLKAETEGKRTGLEAWLGVKIGLY